MVFNCRLLTAPISALTLGLALFTACGDDDAPAADAAAAADASTIDAASGIDAGLPTEFGGARPATLLVPTGYDPATPMPLVVMLHGYNANPYYVTDLLRFNPLRESEGFLFIAPIGTLDEDGAYFWNGTDACCDLFGAGTDDVAYLTGLVDEIAAAYNVDSDRVYAVGHSNGGFMAYRLACEGAGRFAAVISVAGATYLDAGDCTPSEPVSVLQIHGTTDSVIEYAGGTTTVSGAEVPFPSAQVTTERWAAYDGCAATSTAGTPKNLINATAGDETQVLAYDTCPAGIGVELWTIEGSGHATLLNSGQPLWDFLEAHPKP